MKEIPLTKGKVALVDDDMFDELSQVKWFALRCRKGIFYAARNSPYDANGHRRTILMHRVILKVPDGIKVDHWDRNSLNNQRYNLRRATYSQNSMNRGLHSNNTSGFKGLTWYEYSKKWKVRIGLDGEQVYVGLFSDKIEAARAYDKVAWETFGEFACLNFPNEYQMGAR